MRLPRPAARRTPLAAVLTAGLLVAVAGCTPAGDEAAPTAGPATSHAPAAALEWHASDTSVDDRVVHGRLATVTVPEAGDRALVESAGGPPLSLAAGAGRTVTEVLVGTSRVVVVSQDRAEERPNRAVVVDPATGDTREVTDPRPASGGSWALAPDPDTLLYPTYRDGAYCLASHPLDAERGEVVWCAAEGHGFSGVTTSPAGTAMMTFDDRRPVSCRTLTDVDGTPLPGVPECDGWDALLRPGGAVWSTVPDPRRLEEGRFHAAVGDEVVDLGPGVPGSLVSCGDSAWFVRDGERDERPALVRVSNDGDLSVAWEVPGRGEGFLAPPECAGGSVLTLTAYAESGDRRLWADVAGD